MATRYEEAVARGKARHGDRFSEDKLAPDFVRYFNSGERVRVEFGYGETITGRIGITTGWVPAFLLVRRSSDRSSSDVIGAGDRVVAVQRGRAYVEV